jgi:hypothetical protein
MGTNYFKPWLGKNYNKTKILILSESVYSWRDENQGLVNPTSSHPEENLRYWIEHFEELKRGYYKSMGRALCRTKDPTVTELKKAWNDYASTPFVQSSVGEGWNKRPTKKQWNDAAACFAPLMEKLRPQKIIVTGKMMWNQHMPGCTGPHLCDDLQAYKLSDGFLVWCLAIPHPSSRKLKEGFQWERVGRAIHAFRSVKFPLRES